MSGASERGRVRYVAEWVEECEPETAPTDKTQQSTHDTLQAAQIAATSNAQRFAVIPWCYVRAQRLDQQRGWVTVGRWVGDYDGMESVND
ncbi:MAG: hypothetical protein NTZ61_09605 [Proteobacteria bacterium]|nr:hypothetical protein [Pseudomonadota bacterium]